MRKVGLEIESVKARIAALKGKTVKVLINRGRKKIIRCIAELTDIYPSVFTIKVLDTATYDVLSFSYSDVLCGDVKIALLQEIAPQQVVAK